MARITSATVMATPVFTNTHMTANCSCRGANPAPATEMDPEIETVG
jgi:hypothetical protein